MAREVLPACDLVLAVLAERDDDPVELTVRTIPDGGAGRFQASIALLGGSRSSMEANRQPGPTP